jgi:putative SOS response-associated peptidase YedK
MCYDISFQVNIKELADYFPDLIFDSQMEMTFEAFDHVQGVSVFRDHPIIYINRDDLKPHCRLMQWSVVEFFRKEVPDMKRRNGMLNIRSERIIEDRTSYWYKIRNRRCLIPVSGIFEHRGIKGWKKKVPYWVKPKNQKIVFLPGLYSVTEFIDKETGEVTQLWTFGLITRAANSVMKNIHNDGDNRGRMPLFLPFEIAKEFLSEDLTSNEKRYKEILDFEMPSDDLEYHPVFTIRTPKERPDLKPKDEFWEWDKLPALGELNPD